MCMCQRTHLASLKGWGEKQTEQAEPDPTFPDRACAVNTRVLIFSFSSDKGTVIFSQGLHTHRMQQWVALVSESALRLPKRGAHRGSLWPYSQKGNFGKSREKPSRMFVFRSLLRGAWLPAESSLLSFLFFVLSPHSSHLSGISLLPPQLEAPGGCLLGVRPHWQGLSQRGQGLLRRWKLDNSFVAR